VRYLDIIGGWGALNTNRTGSKKMKYLLECGKHMKCAARLSGDNHPFSGGGGKGKGALCVNTLYENDREKEEQK